MKSLSFQTFSGFKELILDHSKFPAKLDKLFSSIDFTKPPYDLRPEYNEICLLDTFFSDSFPPSLLNNIISKSNENGFSTQILILNPFSELAISRSRAIGQNRFIEVNKAIRNVRQGIALLENSKISPNDLGRFFEKSKTNPDFIFEQLNQLRIEKGNDVLVDIKFYNRLSEVPVYILGPFIAKGIILVDTSAEYNPWLIFVDDSSCNGDLYDSYRKNFLNLWNEADEMPGRSRATDFDGNKIFISWGGNEIYKTQVEAIVKKNGFIPISYSMNGKEGKYHLENLQSLTEECDNAIVIMSKEDLMADSKWRARQNVIHELGYCQAIYSRENVLLIVEEEVEMLSNLSGIFHGKLHKNMADRLIKDITNFLETRSPK